MLGKTSSRDVLLAQAGVRGNFCLLQHALPRFGHGDSLPQGSRSAALAEPRPESSQAHDGGWSLTWFLSWFLACSEAFHPGRSMGSCVLTTWSLMSLPMRPLYPQS